MMKQLAKFVRFSVWEK